MLEYIGKMIERGKDVLNTAIRNNCLQEVIAAIQRRLNSCEADQKKFENVAEEPEIRSIWIRLGVTVSGKASDIDTIIQGGKNSGDILSDLLKRGSYRIDGGSYIPETCVEDYNEEYNTNHEVGDVEFNL